MTGLPDLSGKVALVAGASRGIGGYIARALASRGAAVAVAGRTVEPRVNVRGTIGSVAEEIEAAGGRALPVQCDVRDEASVEAAVGRTVNELGQLDVVVCNAGVMWLRPITETSLERWERTLAVNLTGTFLVSRAAIPHLRARPASSLLAITTVGVPMLELGSNAYWVAKAGVERLYRGLAHELRDDNVAVNCLAPVKVVPTEGFRAVGGDLPPEELEDPAYIATAAAYLAGQDAGSCTGRVVYSVEFLDELGLAPVGAVT